MTEPAFVVGTAGHIDHGKSTLITALTGIDPDRLAEEKRRGMTIDLGFAHMRLPSGREIGIVDVPGHARFMRNMLAGTHGLDAVMLVVAADEGVMPQTREHLEIVDLLDVRRGIVVLSKADLVDEAWLELVAAEVRETLKGTSLAGAMVLPVSAASGQGLDELKTALDGLLDGVEARADRGRPRLPIDRVFTMSGFGTVVTGTLVDGTLSVGDELEVVPRDRLVRIRGLQRHNESVDKAPPGSRVAANVIGVEKSELARGDVLAPPHTLASTRRIDAHVRVLASAPRSLRHGAEMLLHTGTSEVGCRVIVLAGDAIEPGGEGWVQLYLERAIAAASQDRFVLRVPSPPSTLAGGRFIDVAPRASIRAMTPQLANRSTGAQRVMSCRRSCASTLEGSPSPLYSRRRWRSHPIWRRSARAGLVSGFTQRTPGAQSPNKPRPRSRLITLRIRCARGCRAKSCGAGSGSRQALFISFSPASSKGATSRRWMARSPRQRIESPAHRRKAPRRACLSCWELTLLHLRRCGKRWSRVRPALRSFARWPSVASSSA